MKKLLYSFTLITLLVFVCISPQFIIFVCGNFIPATPPKHTIEITETGAVTGTSKILCEGNVYTFTEDIVGSIGIYYDNIVLDGAGFTLQGNQSRTGIWLQAKNNVTIENVHITNFTNGIEFTYGFVEKGCTKITISANTITENEYGLRFWLFSSDNYVLGNNISNNTYGVYIDYAPNNVFRNNQMTNNKYNFWVDSTLSSHKSDFVNDIDESNTVNGKPIIYWVNQQNKTVPSNAGYVVLVNCNNMTVQNLVLTNNSQGILLVATNNSLLTKNYMSDNNFGIAVQSAFQHSFNNIITKNNITQNTEDGIYSWGAYNTTVIQNSITNNNQIGANFYDSPQTYIVGNYITGNKGDKTKIWGDSANCTVNNNETELPEHEIPNPISEFSSWTILPMILTGLLVVVVYRKRLKHQN